MDAPRVPGINHGLPYLKRKGDARALVMPIFAEHVREVLPKDVQHVTVGQQ